MSDPTPTQPVTPQGLRALHDDEIAERMRHLATYLRDHAPGAPLDGWLHKDAAFLETYAEAIERAAEPVTEDARALDLPSLKARMLETREVEPLPDGRFAITQAELVAMIGLAKDLYAALAVLAREPGAAIVAIRALADRIDQAADADGIALTKCLRLDFKNELHRLANAIYLAAAPQAETRSAGVTDEMVRVACIAWFRSPRGSVSGEENAMRAAIAAALAIAQVAGAGEAYRGDRYVKGCDNERRPDEFTCGSDHGPSALASQPGDGTPVEPVRCWLSNRSDAVPHPPHVHAVGKGAFWCDGGVPRYNPYARVGIIAAPAPAPTSPVLDDETREALREVADAAEHDLENTDMEDAQEEAADMRGYVTKVRALASRVEPEAAWDGRHLPIARGPVCNCGKDRNDECERAWEAIKTKRAPKAAEGERNG